MPENPSGQARARHPIDLNSESEEFLAEIPEIGPERARTIALHRPFASWEEFRHLPGFDDKLIAQIRSAGFSIVND